MPVNEISQNHKPTEAPMVGDHLAMDLLNTEARSGDKVMDYWNSDADVLRWLQLHGIVPATGSNLLAAGELLKQAKALRALAHQVISSFKQQNRLDISELNLYLHTYVSAPHLQQDSDGKLLITRISRSEPAGAMLGPVAEAVAQLLAEGSAALVKQCEHPDCILWFYDRTKAHKRRWCSMATCGNRYKAAQFRKKQ